MKKKYIVIIAVQVLVLGLLLYMCTALERKTVPQKEQNNEPGIDIVDEKENEELNDTSATEANQEEDTANTETNGEEHNTTELPETEPSETEPPETEPPETEPPETEPPATEPPQADGSSDENAMPWT